MRIGVWRVARHDGVIVVVPVLGNISWKIARAKAKAASTNVGLKIAPTYVIPGVYRSKRLIRGPPHLVSARVATSPSSIEIC